MALLDTEGFGWTTSVTDLTTFGAFNAITASASKSVATSGGPLGDNYLSLGCYGAEYAGRTFPVVLSSFFAGCRMSLLGNSGSPCISFCDSAGNTHLCVVHRPQTLSIAVYRAGNPGNSNAVLLGTSPNNSFPLAGWFYLEIGAVIADGTGGSVTIRVNSVPVLTLAGKNTMADNGTAGVARITWGGFSGSSPTFGFAHYYLCDATGAAPQNTFLGDVRIQTLFPTADDAVQFTPTGGASNYINAARLPPTSASYYNAGSTAGNQDTFACAPMASNLGVIYGLNTKTILLKSDAGARTMANVLKSGAAVAVGPSVSPGTTGQQFSMVSQADPNTSAQWTQGGVNAAKPGYRIVT